MYGTIIDGRAGIPTRDVHIEVEVEVDILLMAVSIKSSNRINRAQH